MRTTISTWSTELKKNPETKCEKTSKPNLKKTTNRPKEVRE